MKEIANITELNGGDIIENLNIELEEAQRRLKNGHSRAKITLILNIKENPEGEAGEFFVLPTYDTVANRRSGDKCVARLKSGKLFQDPKQMRLKYDNPGPTPVKEPVKINEKRKSG